MQTRPLFSIIMPNYNKANYIGEAIESVKSQTYDNWELVIVDDCSTDNSLDVIRKYVDDQRIKFIQNDINRGVAHTAGNAVSNSSGEIVGTLDSDDVLVRTALEEIVEQYKENPQCGLIYSNHYICDSYLNVKGQAELMDPLPEDVPLQELLLSGKSSAISWQFRTFKRSAYNKVEGYDPGMLCYEDRDLYYQLEKVTKLKCFNKCLIYYRDTHEEGAYRRNPKVQNYWFKCEYKETARRFGIKLPYVTNDNISPFLSNLMYICLRRKSKINSSILRGKMQHYLTDMGHVAMKSNKFLAFIYLLNGYLYGPLPLSINKLKSLVNTGDDVI